jgi:hypothetical protein
LLTCIRPPLLCTKCVEGHVLQTPDFRLQKPQVHEGLAAVVVAHRVVHPGAADREDRDPAAVRPAHLDGVKLAAAHEPEGSKEEVVGL